MMITFLILAGKILNFFTIKLRLGSGSTWPGHIALKFNKNFNEQILKKSRTKLVVIAGTNGKTTTGSLITHILNSTDKTAIHNATGANLLNGLASALIKNSNLKGKLSQDYLVFECDENALPEIIKQTNPDYVICLNLFRDQLDRYGEIDSIVKRWKASIKTLTSKTTLILNADDPQISHLGKGVKAKVKYFGLEAAPSASSVLTKTKHGADSTYCPNCSEKLEYEVVFFSHLGVWKCPSCKLKRPTPDISILKTFPLSGTYNRYNSLASALIGKLENINLTIIDDAFNKFAPAFGRGEKIIYKGKAIQIFLSKNPTSFNESLETVKKLGGKNLMIILNDAVPDGLDVSWIWDINFEDILTRDMNIAVTGERTHDMALRIKYAGFFAHHNENSEILLDKMLDSLETDEILHILPNYSAMLDIRKVLTGKKML